MAMFGIFFAIGLIMFLSFRGWSTIWVAPLAAAIVGITGGLSLMNMYLVNYMQGFAGFAMNFFPALMLGAIFGKLMDATLMAKSVALAISNLIGAKHAIFAVIIAGSVLTYGGVSMFVAVFALYPICLVLYRQANIPRRLIPATITVGVFAYTMIALPSSPQIQNIIPGNFFGTPTTAAPALGIITGIIMAGGGYLYLIWKEKKVKRLSETFTEPSNLAAEDPNEVIPNVWVSLLPLVLVVVVLNVLNRAFDWELMPALIFSLILANVLILVLNINKRKIFLNTLNEGAKGALIPIINVSAIVGFGAVVQASTAFPRPYPGAGEYPRQPAHLAGNCSKRAVWRNWFSFRRFDHCPKCACRNVHCNCAGAQYSAGCNAPHCGSFRWCYGYRPSQWGNSNPACRYRYDPTKKVILTSLW